MPILAAPRPHSHLPIIQQAIGDVADFAIIAPLVVEGEDRSLEHCLGIGEIKPALAQRPLALLRIEGHSHCRSLTIRPQLVEGRTSFYRPTKGRGRMTDKLFYGDKIVAFEGEDCAAGVRVRVPGTGTGGAGR
jgi:hypothetical protein